MKVEERSSCWCLSHATATALAAGYFVGACAELYQCLSCLSSLLHCGHITETRIEVHATPTSNMTSNSIGEQCIQ
jgi:hypothetical protein